MTGGGGGRAREPPLTFWKVRMRQLTQLSVFYSFESLCKMLNAIKVKGPVLCKIHFISVFYQQSMEWKAALCDVTVGSVTSPR